MKNANGHKFNVYHRSEVTGRICRHTVGALDWETAQYIRDHWNRRNPGHRKGGAWIDYHDLHLMPIAADAGADSLPYHPLPASTSIGFSEYE